MLRAGHPVPDEDGAQAARRVAERLAESRPADRILALISGGGSAMLPAPVEGVTLTEKQEVNRLLLASGADIRETNLIRQALSRLKGGGWLRQGPAPITATLSVIDAFGWMPRSWQLVRLSTLLACRQHAPCTSRCLGSCCCAQVVAMKARFRPLRRKCGEKLERERATYCPGSYLASCNTLASGFYGFKSAGLVQV